MKRSFCIYVAYLLTSFSFLTYGQDRGKSDSLYHYANAQIAVWKYLGEIPVYDDAFDSQQIPAYLYARIEHNKIAYYKIIVRSDYMGDIGEEYIADKNPEYGKPNQYLNCHPEKYRYKASNYYFNVNSSNK